jgi:hypothetical protein
MRSKIIKFALRAVLVYALFKVVTTFFSNDKQVNSESKAVADARYQISNSVSDGSVPVCKTYLKNNLHDWESYESIEWTKVAKTSDGMLTTVNKFRSKNELGAYRIGYCTFKFTWQGRIEEAVFE